MSETSASRTRLMSQFQLPVRDRCQVFSVQAGTKSRVGGAWGLRPPTISKLPTSLLASTGPSACSRPVAGLPRKQFFNFFLFSKLQITNNPQKKYSRPTLPLLLASTSPVACPSSTGRSGFPGNSNYSVFSLQILENTKYK